MGVRIKRKHFVLMIASIIAMMLLSVGCSLDGTDPADDGGGGGTTYAIGDPGPSGVGIVFYITNGGLHGLEVAPVDQSTFSPWSTITDALANGSSALPVEIGTGSANTDAIIAQNSGADSAALICRAYRATEEGDWFLPSKDELNAIWDNIVDDGSGGNNGVGGFADGSYWSSSESGSGNAWYQYFSDGSQFYPSKDLNVRVRAVRAF